jgi:nucleoside-diphosphate-sugar epimerase
MSTYFVTGGTGNIGAFVTKELASQGDRVVAYDLLPQHHALEILLTPDELTRTTLVQGDVVDLERIVRTLQAHQVDAIAHLGALGTASTDENPAQGIRTNVIGTNNMFEAALITGAARVVFASSGAVFGPKSIGADGVLANDAPYDPQTLYGGTKAMNEVAARFYRSRFGLETVGLRLSGYGPVIGGMAVKWLPELIQALLQERPGNAPSGTGHRGWLYVEDAARAVAAALKVEPCPNTSLTLPVGFPASYEDVIALIRRAFPHASITTAPAPAFWSRSSQSDVRNESDRTRELLGWEPKVGVEEALQKIIAYHRALLAREAKAAGDRVISADV